MWNISAKLCVNFAEYLLAVLEFGTKVLFVFSGYILIFPSRIFLER